MLPVMNKSYTVTLFSQVEYKAISMDAMHSWQMNKASYPQILEEILK